MKGLQKAADRLVNDMLAVQPGETVAVTCDPKTDREMTMEIAKAVHEAGAHPLIIENMPPEGDGVMKETDVPTMALAGAL